MRINLKNDFHNTETYVLAQGEINPEQVKAAKQRLCGIEGCTCSNDLGIRGPQDWEDETLTLTLQHDGSFRVHHTVTSW